MKIKCIFLFVLSFSCLHAQEFPDKEKILDMYNEALDEVTVFGECGHALDQPFYLVKQMEIVSLDFLMDVSEEEEIRIGKEVYDSLSKTLKVVKNHWAQSDVNTLVRRLSKRLKRNKISYTATIFESTEVNAFATLGGNIYITTGLLEFVDSMDELAFVVAHELSHIDLEHTLRKQKKIMMMSSIGNQFDAHDLTHLALDVNMMLSAPFDQIDEYTADKNGFEMAKNAGYNSKAFLQFFKKLEKYEQKTLLQKIVATHPFPSDRKSCIMQYIENSNR